VDAREAEIAKGPRDMSRFVPEGLADARAALSELLDELARDFGRAPLILGGFSQGAMLTCDLLLRTNRPVRAFVQLSGARICAQEWSPLLASRAGLRAFVSHGRSDHDLSFDAAERFKNELATAGWNVEWCPFEGGHEIPLVVLRALKKFLKGL
jgi:phospholipase/carboxylesterase